jgi:two-component system alkaline phosphatase synthesis response regulator PhoP
MTATILIIEDEINIHQTVRSYMESEGFTVLVAEDGEQGLKLFRRYNPVFVVLDIMLPQMDGLEVLQQIRRESEAYVLLLTAKSDEMDRVIGLTVGADDYLTKPFSPRELVARVKTILRRQRNVQNHQNHVLQVHDLKIDSNRHTVWRGETQIVLTALEFKLLEILARHSGMVMSRQQIIHLVWGYDFFGEERIVDVHIGNIRQKLEPDPAAPRYILTVRGVGYKIEDISQ